MLFFSQSDAQLGLVVPIPLLIATEDALRWSYERQGRVTVRSAYHHFRAQEGRGQTKEHITGMGDRSGPNLWEVVWKSKVQLKVCVFIWKLLSNAVAVREGLVRRGLQVSCGCPMCNQAESSEHLILGCQRVKQVWDDLLGLKDASDGCSTIKDWLLKRLSDQLRSR